MSKLIDYPAATRFDSGDILIKDGTNGTKKITAKNAAIDLAGMVSAEQHRMIWGGRNLGTSVSAEQKAAIRNRTFDNLYIGDYWVINGITWRIWDICYFTHSGDNEFTKPHLVIVPDSALYSHVMNDTNTTEGGYVGSKMYKEGLEQAKTTIKAAFGDMLLTHRDYLTNAVTDGKPSAGGWFDSQVELMNEIMVYGCHVHTPGGDGATVPYNYTTGRQQFAAAMLNPSIVNLRYWYWLRDVVSSAVFAGVNAGGYAASVSASISGGVRPYFLIG